LSQHWIKILYMSSTFYLSINFSLIIWIENWDQCMLTATTSVIWGPSSPVISWFASEAFQLTLTNDTQIQYNIASETDTSHLSRAIKRFGGIASITYSIIIRTTRSWSLSTFVFKRVYVYKYLICCLNVTAIHTSILS
jgi:hypothetical protein